MVRVLTYAAAALGLTLGAPARAATGDLDLVEQHLAATRSLTADFIQTDARGRSLKGTLQIQRPGRVRFDYGPQAKLLLVGDGARLSFVDYNIGQVSSWPIASSPLAVLLAARPDLGRIARIEKQNDPRLVVVRARDARRPEFGTLILAFSRDSGAPGGLKLQAWTAFDAQNKRTNVRLSGQRYNVAVPDSAFRFTPPAKRR